MTLIPLRKAIRLTGLCAKTLRKYADDGTIKSTRTPGGMRLFDEEDLCQFGSETPEPDQSCTLRLLKCQKEGVEKSGQRQSAIC